MIVFLLGGHGSGKSTAVRVLMKGRGMVPVYRPDRVGRPVGYLQMETKLFVVGHYELVNGGADTVRPLTTLATVIGDSPKGGNVVLEGIGQAGILTHVLPLMRRHGGRGLLMKTSLDVCIRSVHRRGHALSDEGVRRGWVRAENMAKKMTEAGFAVDTVTRNNVVGKLRELTR